MKINIEIEKANIKDLNKTRPHLMRALHHTFGYNFNKDYNFYHITGRFTLKSIDPFTYGQTVILINDPNIGGWENDLFCVKYSYGDIDIDLYKYDRHNRMYFDGMYNEKFSDFCRKCDFEDMRKSPTSEAWILSQDLKFMGYPAPPIGEKMDIRYKFKDNDLIPYGYNGDYIGAYHSRRYNEDALDASGYLINEYRTLLKRKAEELKAKREKDAYLMTDNTDKVATLERLIEKYKAKLSEQLLAIKTVNDVYEVDRLIGWNGLHTIIEDFTTFKEHTETKAFPSIKASDALYDRINKLIYNYI